MLGDVSAQIIPDPVCIPTRRDEETLHPVGCRLADFLSQLLPILALDPAQQATHVPERSAARLMTKETSADSLVQPLQLSGPVLDTPRTNRIDDHHLPRGDGQRTSWKVRL
jgi:hypothetical protein